MSSWSGRCSCRRRRANGWGRSSWPSSACRASSSRACSPSSGQSSRRPSGRPPRSSSDRSPPVEPLTPAEVQIRRPLGEIFVELGFISSDQLDAALDTQRETGARIGEILVEQGSLTRLDLASALAEQWSALQKLRPPAPVAEPTALAERQPATSTAPAEPEPSADDRAVVTALDERLRVVERAAAATPVAGGSSARHVRPASGDQSRRRAARDDAASPGAAELEVGARAPSTRGSRRSRTRRSPTELAAVRQELDELKSRPVTEEGVADLRAAIERLEGRPDQTDEISRLSAEIAGLASRLDGLAAVGELTNKLDAVAGQAEVAQTGIAGLSRRVDDLAGLEKRLDELAARLPGDDVIEELRRALTDLATQAGNDDRSDQGADIASLVARLDQVTARVEDVATTRAPDLTPRIDDLSARIDEVAAAIPNVETDGSDHTARVARGPRPCREWRDRAPRGRARRSGNTSRGSAGRPCRIRTRHVAGRRASCACGRVGGADREGSGLGDARRAACRGWTSWRLRSSGGRCRDCSTVCGSVWTSWPRRCSEGRTGSGGRASCAGGRAGGYVAAGPGSAPVEELRVRVDELAAAVERGPDSAMLDELRSRLDELAVAVGRGPDPGLLDGLRFRLDELAEAVERVPDPASVEELRVRVDELAAAVGRGPDSAMLDELRSRLDELAVAVGGGRIRQPLDALRARVAELAAACRAEARYRAARRDPRAAGASSRTAVERRRVVRHARGTRGRAGAPARRRDPGHASSERSCGASPRARSSSVSRSHRRSSPASRRSLRRFPARTS